ncbi:MAG: hypothetical protein K2Q20_13065 [Phycisphaerales bacterium]|nr:hypothetical protein [Phycisphaerales bacterium]
MARTNQEKLDDVDAAIAAIESGGQSYTTPLGTVITRGDLKALYAQRSELEGLLAMAALPGDVPAVMPIALGRIQ